MRLLPPVAAAALSVSLLAAPAQAQGSWHDTPEAPSPAPAPAAVAPTHAKVPALKVRKLVTGLDLVWDVKSIGAGKLLLGGWSLGGGQLFHKFLFFEFELNSRFLRIGQQRC